MSINPFCLASYLRYRYVVEPGHEWIPGLPAHYPDLSEVGSKVVHDADEIMKVLEERVQALPQASGILLSGGIDSAILAALMGKGTKAYTIRFVAEGAVKDESPQAAVYAEALGLEHRIVEVSWDDFESKMDALMQHKAAPLHPVEVGLYCAAQAAQAEGIEHLVVGNGADSTFGGLSKLLSKDWSFSEFVERYSFVDPAQVLLSPPDTLGAYEKYRIGAEGENKIDVMGFLKEIHGIGIVQAFENGIGLAGCRTEAPYEVMRLGGDLDIERIRGGESKYLLVEVFNSLYPHLDAPEKVAFARPMEVWMRDWKAPESEYFLPNLKAEDFSAEQKWMIYCLNRFVEGILAEDSSLA